MEDVSQTYIDIIMMHVCKGTYMYVRFVHMYVVCTVYIFNTHDVYIHTYIYYVLEPVWT
jgi:hypothetical protein